MPGRQRLSPEELLQRGRGEASLYMKFFGWKIHAVKQTSWKNANHKEQIPPVNNFSASLPMGRYKNLGSLKFFLRYASNYVRACLSKAEGLSLFFILNFSRLHCGWATAVGYDLTLAERGGEQSYFVLLC